VEYDTINAIDTITPENEVLAEVPPKYHAGAKVSGSHKVNAPLFS